MGSPGKHDWQFELIALRLTLNPSPLEREFTFLMFNKYCFFYLIFFLLLNTSCRFNPPLQARGIDILQGEWAQDSVRMQNKLLDYTLYQFRITCDSIYITTNNASKVNYGTDTCMNQGKWKEYIRGKYELHHDTLRVKGMYCNPDFSLKDKGCFHIGVYEELFKLQKQTDSLYRVTSFSSTVPFNLRLTKRIACNPKPL